MKKIVFILSCIFSCLCSSAQTPQLVPGNYQIPAQNIPPNSIGRLSECIGLGNDLVFVAKNQLWITDGTSSGTLMLMDFLDNDSLRPTGLTLMNGNIYFFADDGINGQELWKTDGTQPGTSLVKDINPGAASAITWKQTLRFHLRYNIQVLNNRIYFIADDGLHGREIWSSDGTASGTVMFHDFYPGAGGGAPFQNQNMIATANKLFFTAISYAGTDTFLALHATDGTWANTNVIFDSVYIDDLNMLLFNDKIIFSPQTLTHNTYISDGTSSGTFVIVPNEHTELDVAVINNNAYFFSITGATLMKTDGTLAGTSVVRNFGNNLAYLNTSRDPSFRINTLGQNLIISAYDTSTGHELWISDGTPAGTSLLKDFWPGTLGTPYSSRPFHLTQFNNRIYFRVIDSTRYNLGYTDGTTTGTQLVNMPGANSHETFVTFFFREYSNHPMISTGNALYFYARYDTLTGPRIYKLDLFPAEIGKTPGLSSIDIYPNPTQGYITIDAENAKSISVNSIEGKQVYKADHLNSNKTTIGTHSLAAGTYTITTLLKDGTKRFGKFVKQ